MATKVCAAAPIATRMLQRTLRASLLVTAFLIVAVAWGQPGRTALGHTGRNGHTQKGDSTEQIPRGLTTWTIDERFGTVIPTVPDTIPHLFQNDNRTEGRYGTYNTTGNLGAPRMSRIYNGNQDAMMGEPFVFAKPYSYVLQSVKDCAYTNTKSPITNLSYMSQGNKTNGDDRLRALFATNAGKRAGMGFKVDYLYGRGYFEQQQQSSIAAKIFGSYRGERYQMHSAYVLDRTKNAENGGLEEDAYITHPEYYSTKYAPADMPVRLQDAYNRLKINSLFLTHCYKLGYYQWIDAEDRRVKSGPAFTDSTHHAGAPLVSSDSLPQPAPSTVPDSTMTRAFVPVAAFIHTLNVDHNRRYYIDYRSADGFYAERFYENPGDSINDMTRYISVQNTLAIEMSEGFRPWVKTGMRLFAKHEFSSFSLPDKERRQQASHYNYITLGAQLMRRSGSMFHYNVLGEMRTTGSDWGEFNVEGDFSFHIPIRKDSLELAVNGFIRNEEPSYYYRHFHSTVAWWDKDLQKVFRARAEASLAWRKTRLTATFETIQHHTFWQQLQQLPDDSDSQTTTSSPQAIMRYAVSPMQATGNVQLLQLSLNQDFTLGPLNWENRLTLQKTSDERVLPLPLFNAWSNLYLLFRIAKVLRTEIGADVTYYTQYYAPAYSPMVGAYAVQDEAWRTKLGNYPWVNVYANFHLKNCRFYIMMGHVNCGSGHYFMVPHYPTNQRVFRFGISWNFFN